MALNALLLTLATAGLALGAALEPRFTVGQTVQTNNGPITGQAASVANQVSEYLGIPFAQPPLGDLRFAAPVKYSGNTALTATRMSASCPALGSPDISNAAAYPNTGTVRFGPNGVKIMNQIIAANTPFVEDCLKLNIWTKPQTGEAKKAVLLWIYGGNFVQGATNNTIYNGQFLADNQDVVVVNFNYRTNIFGFPGAPNAGNLGLLDQRMAVQWVRDNIANFGGDPTRITLFGHSTGAVSLDHYSLAYYNNDPIINSFIQESGNVIQIPPTLPAVAQYNWNQVTSDLGCGDSSADQSQVLACMRRSDVTIQRILASAARKGTIFTPIADGVTAFGDSEARLADGRFIKKPWLIGSTSGEAGFINTIFQAQNGFALPQALIDFATLAIYTCPARLAAQYRRQNNVATWRYRFFGLFQSTIVSTVPDSGVYHAAEIPYVFNTTAFLGGPGDTAAERSFITYIQGAWAGFAKNPVSGLNTYGWPSYDPNGNTLVQLGSGGINGPNPVNPTLTTDVLCLAAIPTFSLILAVGRLFDGIKAGSSLLLALLF